MGSNHHLVIYHHIFPMLAREGREKSYAYWSKVENKKNKSYVWPLFNHPLHLEPTSCRNPTMFGPTRGSEYYKTVYGPYLRCEAAGFICSLTASTWVNWWFKGRKIKTMMMMMMMMMMIIRYKVSILFDVFYSILISNLTLWFLKSISENMMAIILLLNKIPVN